MRQWHASSLSETFTQQYVAFNGRAAQSRLDFTRPSLRTCVLAFTRISFLRRESLADKTKSERKTGSDSRAHGAAASLRNQRKGAARVREDPSGKEAEPPRPNFASLSEECRISKTAWWSKMDSNRRSWLFERKRPFPDSFGFSITIHECA